MDVRVGLWRKLSPDELMLLNCGVGEDSWESPGLQGDPTSASLGVHWKDWCWSWNSNTLATWYKELTLLRRPWCWERLRAGGEGDDRGWDGWMTSPTRWTWVWVNSRSWWWTGRPGMLWFMGSQRVGHDWATVLNWTGNTQPLPKETVLCSRSPSLKGTPETNLTLAIISTIIDSNKNNNSNAAVSVTSTEYYWTASTKTYKTAKIKSNIDGKYTFYWDE